MKVIIGLGNIGKEFENTRHNLGFMAIDYLGYKYNIKLDKKKKKYIYGEGVINNNKVVFVKPTTFMNLSGEAVVQVINWYKIDIKDILVILDDIDLPFGKVRLRKSGSAGTHNGLKNIVQNLNTEEFARLRIGMENRKSNTVPLIDYVLQKFTTEELNHLKSEIMEEVDKNVTCFLTNS